jgi:hypothetical protein
MLPDPHIQPADPTLPDPRSQVPSLQAKLPKATQKPFRCLHDNSRHIDVDFDALVGQDASTIDVDLVADCDIVAENTDVLQSSPLPDCRVPAYDSALYPSVVFDLRSCQ